MDHKERLKAALADRYQIEREIGAGGMATVYLAHDLKHDRQVAVKVLNPELAETLGAERFLREIKTVANLAHPHILPVFDSGEADGFLFFVMPYVKGATLRTRLEKEKQLPIEEAFRVTREIASALAYAHEEGIIHRDVKPENIMLEAGHAVLADFGVAYAVSEAQDERLTQTGTSLGTPSYMSPEQATGEADVDGRSDQYALACVLYEMLAGDPPFKGPSGGAVVRKHITDEPASVASARPSIDEGVADSIHRALSKNPADRFRTTADFAAALTEPIGTGKGTSKKRWRGAVVGGLGIMAVLAVGWALRGTIRDWLSEDAPPTLSVLPPETVGLDERDAAFADRLAGEIYGRLDEVIGIGLRTRYSASQFDIRGMTYPELGDSLESDYLLALRVYREVGDASEGTLGAHADLVRASDGENLWFDEFSDVLESEFEVQGQIAEHVAQQLDDRLGAPERARLRENPTDSRLAWELFQEGQRILNSGGGPWLNLEAEEKFEAAIAEDSTFIRAYTGLASARFAAGAAGAEGEIERGEEALARIIQLDPNLREITGLEGGAHYARGQYGEAAEKWEESLRWQPSEAWQISTLALVQRRLGRWDEALANFEKSVEFGRHIAELWLRLGTTQVLMRRYSDAAGSLLRATALKQNDLGPIVPVSWRAQLMLVAEGDVAEAKRLPRENLTQEELQQLMITAASREPNWMWLGLPSQLFEDELIETMAVSPGVNPAIYAVARAVIAEAEGDTALATTFYEMARVPAEDYMRSQPDNYFSHGFLGVVYAGMGMKEEAIQKGEEAVRLLPISEDHFQGPEALMILARICVMVGEYEEAIEHLELVVTIPSRWSRAFLGMHPQFAPLREFPRFQALVKEPETVF